MGGISNLVGGVEARGDDNLRLNDEAEGVLEPVWCWLRCLATMKHGSGRDNKNKAS
jgi:hypothetical protein